MARPKKQIDDTNTPDAPRISVIDRKVIMAQRMKNPFGTPSMVVPLRGAKRGWEVRTFVADAEHPNRHYDAVFRLGWVPLTARDLDVSPESLGYNVAPDGRIVRGRHSEEVLMAMPKDDFRAAQTVKSQTNLAGLKPQKVRTEVAQATAKAHGDEAGDMTYRNYSQKDIVEPVPGPTDAA